MKTRLMRTTILLTILALAGSAQASNWCGENGLVRFSFADGEEIVSVGTAEPDDTGVTLVDVFAWITDVTPLKKDGEAFLATAAVEMMLKIEGAEGFIIETEFFMKSRNVGRGPGTIAVGFDPGLQFEDGRTKVVRWRVLFQGKPENVVFSLDQSGLQTATTLKDYNDAGTWALYTGTWASDTLGDMFGCGFVPAYLNYDGEPDLEPRRGKMSWEEGDLYEKR